MNMMIMMIKLMIAGWPCLSGRPGLVRHANKGEHSWVQLITSLSVLLLLIWISINLPSKNSLLIASR